MQNFKQVQAAVRRAAGKPENALPARRISAGFQAEGGRLLAGKTPDARKRPGDDHRLAQLAHEQHFCVVDNEHVPGQLVQIKLFRRLGHLHFDVDRRRQRVQTQLVNVSLLENPQKLEPVALTFYRQVPHERRWLADTEGKHLDPDGVRALFVGEFFRRVAHVEAGDECQLFVAALLRFVELLLAEDDGQAAGVRLLEHNRVSGFPLVAFLKLGAEACADKLSF